MKFTAKFLSIMLLATVMGTQVQARNAECCEQKSSCCGWNSYECGCNPLYCGAWDVQIQGGVDFVLWRNRQPILGVDCTVSAAVPVLTLFTEVPTFKSLFKTPWYVGGQFGYHMSDNCRAYVEFNYTQANAKTNVTLTTNYTGAIPYTFNFNKYKLFDAFVGARYYFNRWCDHASFFVGAKVGLAHHNKLQTSLSFALPVPATPVFPTTEVYAANTCLSGGGNVGIDICFCGNWSFVVTGEIVANAGPTALTVLTGGVVTVPAAITSFMFGTFSELRFPVTAALRYSF